MQVLATEAPVAVEYFPVTHSRQTLAPSAAEYVPAAHAMQVLFEEAPLVEEYVPAAQLVQTVATAAEYVPAVQSLQSAARAYIFVEYPRLSFNYNRTLVKCNQLAELSTSDLG